MVQQEQDGHMDGGRPGDEEIGKVELMAELDFLFSNRGNPKRTATGALVTRRIAVVGKPKMLTGG